MHGMRVLITMGEFQNLCDLHDEGTFMAQRGLWHKMQKKFVNKKNGGLSLLNEIREAKIVHSEDKRTFALRELEFGGHGNVKKKKTTDSLKET